VWSGVGGSGRRSPSPANVSLPDRLGPEDGVGSSSVDTCGSLVFLSSVDASNKLSRCSGTRSGSSGAWFGRRFGLVKDWLLLALRAGAEGSAERLLRLRAAKLEKEAEAAVVVSVSVLEWRVVGVDCLRRKKGRDSEKRTMATRDLGGHSRACCWCAERSGWGIAVYLLWEGLEEMLVVGYGGCLALEYGTVGG
jgi:hypothetical protein